MEAQILTAPRITARFVEDHVEVFHNHHRSEIICFTPKDWKAFVSGVKNNEFDLEQLALNTDKCTS